MPNSALSLALDLPPFGNLAQNAFAFYQATTLGLTDNDAMTSWVDLSPNLRNLSINSGSPTYKVVGGKGCVSFDGSDDAFQNASFDLNGVSEISLHLVSAYNNSGQTNVENDGPVFINETGGWGKLFLGALSNSIQWRLGSGLASNNQSYSYSAPGTGNFTTISLIRTVSGTVSERLWVNGSLADTKSLGSTNTTLANLATTLILGKGSGNFTNCYIRGFAVYLGNTEDSRADIEAALS